MKRGRMEEGEGRTPHSEALPWITLKYIPENSGQSGHRFQKYESTDTVSTSGTNDFKTIKCVFGFRPSYVNRCFVNARAIERSR